MWTCVRVHIYSKYTRTHAHAHTHIDTHEHLWKMTEQAIKTLCGTYMVEDENEGQATCCFVLLHPTHSCCTNTNRDVWGLYLVSGWWWRYSFNTSYEAVNLYSIRNLVVPDIRVLHIGTPQKNLLLHIIASRQEWYNVKHFLEFFPDFILRLQCAWLCSAATLNFSGNYFDDLVST